LLPCTTYRPAVHIQAMHWSLHDWIPATFCPNPKQSNRLNHKNASSYIIAYETIITTASQVSNTHHLTTWYPKWPPSKYSRQPMRDFRCSALYSITASKPTRSLPEICHVSDLNNDLLWFLWPSKSSSHPMEGFSKPGMFTKWYKNY
jgi:hypothetical protein